MNAPNNNQEKYQNNYKKGETAYYHEAGEIFCAIILQNKSDEHFDHYELRLVYAIKTSFSSKLPQKGLEIDVIKAKDAQGATWRLLDHIDDVLIRSI